MDRYLAGEDIDVATLIADLERAVARGAFHPVLTAAPAADGARQGIGTVELLELITRGFPTPLERTPPVVTTPSGKPRPAPVCDPGAPLVAEVVKTSSDPYVGRVSLVRVFSGTLRPDDSVHLCGHGLDATGTPRAPATRGRSASGRSPRRSADGRARWTGASRGSGVRGPARRGGDRRHALPGR